jgi:hypothetical protein
VCPPKILAGPPRIVAEATGADLFSLKFNQRIYRIFFEFIRAI